MLEYMAFAEFDELGYINDFMSITQKRSGLRAASQSIFGSSIVTTPRSSQSTACLSPYTVPGSDV